MKYTDKNTRKNILRWQNRQEDNDNIRQKIREENHLRKMIRDFSYTITDKLWWNSLTKEDQRKAYHDYCNYADLDLWWTSGSGSGFYNYSNNPINPDISPEEHIKRINYLKENYKRPNRRRDLVIDDILKYEE